MERNCGAEDLSDAEVNPTSDKSSARALTGVERRPQGFGKEIVS